MAKGFWICCVLGREVRPPPNCILFWRSEVCGVPLHCHYSKRDPSMDQIDLFWNHTYSIGLCIKNKILIGRVSLFWCHINLRGLLNAKAILLKEQQWCYLTHSWEDEGVHTFPKGICWKVNVIGWLEFELAYNNSAVQRFNHYTTGTPPLNLEKQQHKM